MKFLFLIILMSQMLSLALAADEKIYTQKQFDDELDRKLKEEVVRIKQKGVVELTHEILARESEMRTKEKDLKRRVEEYNINVADFSKKIQDFEKHQSDFISCVNSQNQEKDTRISRMVKVVSGMKPDKAAALIAEQDPEVSVKILSLLDPDKTSKIFNMMEKEKSALLQKRYLDMKR